MTYCPQCRRTDPLPTTLEFSLLLFIAAAVFVLLCIAYQAGFEAGAASAALGLDTYTP